jgi:LysM repeat protein
MEDEEIETSSGSSLLPIAIAVLAVVLGGAGLYFGLTANQRINPLSETMEAGSSSTARLEKQIAGLETRISELSANSADLEKTIDRMRLYANQGEQTVKQVAGAVRDNRDEIVKIAKRFNELVAKGLPAAPAAKTASAPAASPASRSGPSAGSDGSDGAGGDRAGGTYTIKSGDYFAKIANELGVDLQALIDANPGTDARRLRIGQVINIPRN